MYQLTAGVRAAMPSLLSRPNGRRAAHHCYHACCLVSVCINTQLKSCCSHPMEVAQGVSLLLAETTLNTMYAPPVCLPCLSAGLALLPCLLASLLASLLPSFFASLLVERRLLEVHGDIWIPVLGVDVVCSDLVVFIRDG
eukprot:m.75989 g.75989  ORF g.75989 m.75989 type:complete len:140 (+) comp14009_c0_seq1:387-806(+)